MKAEQCVKCGRVWHVSAKRPAKKMYVCPDCEDKILGKPKRTKTGVWVA